MAVNKMKHNWKCCAVSDRNLCPVYMAAIRYNYVASRYGAFTRNKKIQSLD